MSGQYIAALVFALMALPAFVFANWLRDGRLPLAGGGEGLTERDRRALDSRLARMMRMAGVATLATGGGLALWGDDERRVLLLVAVMVLVVNGLAAAMLVAVRRARHASRMRR